MTYILVVLNDQYFLALTLFPKVGILQLNRLVDAGNTVISVEHDMQVIASSDWVIDIGPGAGEDGGKVVVSGTPGIVASHAASRTAPYLARYI